ncbi:MAG: NAD-dependent epimerase/dehydratase family protein [Chloroflexota bacterium]
MRILITGSSGQIGTNLGLFLQSQGHDILGIDKRSNTWTDQIETIIQDLSIPYHNFENGIGDVRYPGSFDMVVHLAAYAKVHELVDYPGRALENTIMVHNALEYCRHQNIPIIFGSSRETYGNVEQDAENISEEMANFFTAASPYSASKLAGEAMVYAYARCYDIPYLVFRFSNVYGRYDNDIERMERVIPLFIHKMRQGESVTVYGRDKLLDFTYVDDCINGIARGVHALAKGQVQNETMNLAFGQGNSLIKMTDYISDALGIVPNMVVEPSQRGEVKHYIANISKAGRLLGYEPTTPLQEGIQKAVTWSSEWEAGSRK